jgi:5-methylcytosine-specific restriction endonuclease McrA
MCRYCGVHCADAFEIDHIVPWSAGGWNSIVNYALACVTCNQVKGAKRLHVDVEWRMIHDNLERMTRGV